ncbi:YceI family protein [Sulfuriroseicoccus oceanibius]|uniref:YceI family protein n=1 Tax=Sulfuriroseicoccus oceanibius TaxID=2707525 RepID=A0A6B3LAR8_9BACT|nr:YceI family protein [Sulfuriroseicoccus oceanibius]QQL46006.1 YceI family protein [Sulfuriroseicoccus oceanibius]
MKTKTIITSVAAIATAAAISSCGNPADSTADAEVKDAVEKQTTTSAEGVRYVFAPESTIEFTGSKVTGKHDGGFKTFTGHFTIADGQPVGNDHSVSIDMTSTWSDAEKLTGHLKSADFFDVEQFPTSTFDVTGVTKQDDGTYKVAGNFTFHGVTKNITFPATVDQSEDKITISSEFDINRSDFGVTYPGMKDDLIRDEVIIRLNLIATPEA